MTKIDKIVAEKILDSRGNETIKVSAFAGGHVGAFSVPAGASTGAHEAHVLLVAEAIEKVNGVIAQKLIGMDVENQAAIDSVLIGLDGSVNKEKLGGNSMIGASIAVAKLAAANRGKQTFEYLRTLLEIGSSRKVPYLYMNLINGGMHAKNGLAFQEYHVVPIVDDVALAIEMGKKIWISLGEIISEQFGESSFVLGDEGGFAPKIFDIRKPVELLMAAIFKNSFQDQVRLALDVAASSFYNDGEYLIAGEKITGGELMKIYNSLIGEFNLISIEDPFYEEDFENFAALRSKHPNLLVVGDDLTTTNQARLSRAINEKSINAMIIKPNQIGTLTETLQTMKLARDNGVELIVSHRSGETDDDFIADLCYAFGCFGLKSGAPQKSERAVKYARLAEISAEK